MSLKLRSFFQTILDIKIFFPIFIFQHRYNESVFLINTEREIFSNVGFIGTRFSKGRILKVTFFQRNNFQKNFFPKKQFHQELFTKETISARIFFQRNNFNKNFFPKKQFQQKIFSNGLFWSLNSVPKLLYLYDFSYKVRFYFIQYGTKIS